MNLIRTARAFGASFALVLLGAIAFAAFTLPSVQGPSQGDYNVNPYTLALAINSDTQAGFSAALTATGTSSQTGSLALVNPFNQVTTAGAAAGVVLPTATGGRGVVVFNSGTGSIIQIFGSNSPFTAGTNDTINGTTGSTSYLLPNNNVAICKAVANGAWACIKGS